MKNSQAYHTYQLLLANKIQVDKEELHFQIESHPSYPSLHAITGVLTHFDIDNLAIEVPIVIDVLEQLPNNFLALIETGESKEFVVTEKKGNDFVNRFSDGSKEQLSGLEFLKNFTGIIVAVEKSVHYQESKQNKGLIHQLIPVLPVLLLPMLYLIFSPSFSAISHFTLAFLGVIISYILIKEENGIDTALGKAFCSGASEKRDSKSVINSNRSLPA